MNDIVERLRSWEKSDCRSCVYDDMNEAADEIERLQADLKTAEWCNIHECVGLKAENERLRELCDSLEKENTSATRQIFELLDETKRLRAALAPQKEGE